MTLASSGFPESPPSTPPALLTSSNVFRLFPSRPSLQKSSSSSFSSVDSGLSESEESWEGSEDEDEDEDYWAQEDIDSLKRIMDQVFASTNTTLSPFRGVPPPNLTSHIARTFYSQHSKERSRMGKPRSVRNRSRDLKYIRAMIVDLVKERQPRDVDSTPRVDIDATPRNGMRRSPSDLPTVKRDAALLAQLGARLHDSEDPVVTASHPGLQRTHSYADLTSSPTKPLTEKFISHEAHHSEPDTIYSPIRKAFDFMAMMSPKSSPSKELNRNTFGTEQEFGFGSFLPKNLNLITPRATPQHTPHNSQTHARIKSLDDNTFGSTNPLTPVSAGIKRPALERLGSAFQIEEPSMDADDDVHHKMGSWGKKKKLKRKHRSFGGRDCFGESLFMHSKGKLPGSQSLGALSLQDVFGNSENVPPLPSFSSKIITSKESDSSLCSITSVESSSLLRRRRMKATGSSSSLTSLTSVDTNLTTCSSSNGEKMDIDMDDVPASNWSGKTSLMTSRLGMMNLQPLSPGYSSYKQRVCAHRPRGESTSFREWKYPSAPQ